MAKLKNTKLNDMLPESVDGVSTGSNGDVSLGAVRYSATQSLTDVQKSQARGNIDAVSTANATLEAHGFSEWVFPGFPEIEEYTERNLFPCEYSQGIGLEYRARDKDWETGEWGDWYLLAESDNYAPLDATSFTWLMPSGGEEPNEYTGTRTAQGYRLGPASDSNPNRNMLLASEAEVEALRLVGQTMPESPTQRQLAAAVKLIFTALGGTITPSETT